jgi:hypothetical protein
MLASSLISPAEFEIMVSRRDMEKSLTPVKDLAQQQLWGRDEEDEENCSPRTEVKAAANTDVAEAPDSAGTIVGFVDDTGIENSFDLVPQPSNRWQPHLEDRNTNDEDVHTLAAAPKEMTSTMTSTRALWTAQEHNSSHDAFTRTITEWITEGQQCGGAADSEYATRSDHGSIANRSTAAIAHDAEDRSADLGSSTVEETRQLAAMKLQAVIRGNLVRTANHQHVVDRARAQLYSIDKPRSPECLLSEIDRLLQEDVCQSGGDLLDNSEDARITKLVDELEHSLTSPPALDFLRQPPDTTVAASEQMPAPSCGHKMPTLAIDHTVLPLAARAHEQREQESASTQQLLERLQGVRGLVIAGRCQLLAVSSRERLLDDAVDDIDALVAGITADVDPPGAKPRTPADERPETPQGSYQRDAVTAVPGRLTSGTAMLLQQVEGFVETDAWRRLVALEREKVRCAARRDFRAAAALRDQIMAIEVSNRSIRIR